MVGTINNSKTRYNSYFIVFMLFLVFIGLVNSISNGDASVCPDGSVLKTINGTWECNSKAYAEGWFKNNTDPLLIEIDSSNTFYNITNFTQGDYKNVYWANGGIIINNTGTYLLSGTISFSGGNNGEYGFVMTINNVPKKDCAMGMTSDSNIGNVGLTCVENLLAGDQLNLKVNDRASPSQDVNIYGMSINIIEI